MCCMSNDKIQFNAASCCYDLKLATEKKPGFFLVLEVLVFVIEKGIFILIGCLDSCLVIFCCIMIKT